MTKKIDKPIGLSEAQFIAFAKVVIDLERDGVSDRQPASPRRVRVASLAELKNTGNAGVATGPRAVANDHALFSIND